MVHAKAWVAGVVLAVMAALPQSALGFTVVDDVSGGNGPEVDVVGGTTVATRRGTFCEDDRAFEYQYVRCNVAVEVPEPATILLLGVGSLGLALSRRLRRRRAGAARLLAFVAAPRLPTRVCRLVAANRGRGRPGIARPARWAASVAVVALLLGAGVRTADASDVFLKVPELPGDSLDNRHRDSIDVLAFEQTVVGASCRFTVTKLFDRATPGLAELASARTMLASGTLYVHAGADSPAYYTVDLSGLTVLSAEPTLAAVDARGTETVLLSVRSFKVTYVRYMSGKPVSTVTKTVRCSSAGV